MTAPMPESNYNTQPEENNVQVVLFRNRADTTPRSKPEGVSRESLVSLLTSYKEREDKDGLAWSPVIYRAGTTRGNEGVEAVTMAVFDFDNGSSIEDMTFELRTRGLAHCVYTTHSHTQERPHFRIAMFLKEPVPAASWLPVWEWIAQEMFDNQCDLGVKDQARLFYLPSCRPEADRFATHSEGADFDWEATCDIPDTEPIGLDEAREKRRNGHVVELPEVLPQVDVNDLHVSDRIKKLIREGYNKAEPGKYRSRSEAQFAVILGLAESGYDDTTIVAIFGDESNGIGTKARKQGVDWLKGDIARARAKAALVERASAEEVPPFPTRTLPTAFASLVKEGAVSTVVPPEFIAVPLLAAAGAAIGNALELELKAGYREGTNIYAAIVGDPGSKKTPAINVASGSTHRMQGRLKDDHNLRLKEYEADMAVWESRPKQERGSKPEPPTFQHMYSTDATTEALAGMLASGKGVLLEMDELTGWVKSMDQYRGGRGADRAFFLRAWSRATIKSDRKGNPTPIMVERPLLAVAGGVQPDLLGDLADASRREDGFLDRLLWAYPPPLPDYWEEAGLLPETTRPVDLIFERLYQLRTDIDEEGNPVARVVVLSPPAQALWKKWYGGHVKESEAEGFSAKLKGPWAKMPSQAARLALILHAVQAAEAEQEPAAKPVSAETLLAALGLVAYFKAHARKVYRQLGTEQRDLKMRVLVALKEQGPMLFTQILKDVLKRNTPSAKLRSSLEELRDMGLVASREIREPGRPQATGWEAL